MRASTPIHIAIRNIGDSQDTGTYFEGTLSTCVLWLAEKLSAVSMATRIVIGIGRDKEAAGRGIDVKGAGQQAVSQDMMLMLKQILDTDPDDSSLELSGAGIQRGAAPKIEGDDYNES